MKVNEDKVMNIHNKNGFSLIEVLIVVGLIALVAGATLSMFFTGQGSWLGAEAKIAVQDESRKGMQQLYRELRASGYNADADESHLFIESSGRQVTFQVPVLTDNTVSLDADGNINWGTTNTTGGFLRYGLTSGQLKRYVLDTDQSTVLSERVLANNINSVDFSLINNTTLEITVTARKQDSRGSRNWENSLQTRITLRN